MKAGCVGLLAPLLLILACGPADTGERRPLVAVSVLPQKFFVDRIAGDRVDVAVMIPPGASPATHEPGLAELQALDRAILYVRVGHPRFPFEQAWLAPLLAERRGLVVVGAADDLPPDVADPHLWLDPARVRRQAAEIEAALARLLPEQAEAFAAGGRRFQAEIDALDAELRRLLEPLRGRRFWVFHPAWGHLARAYGLRQVAVEQDGKEPDPMRLAVLIADARSAGVRRILVQPQFSHEAAQVIAAEIGAELVTLDPLAYEWLGNLRRAGEQIAEAAVP